MDWALQFADNNALGHRVEKNVSGTYTEYVYHPSGEQVGENNRSSWMQVIPLQGRHIAHYNNGAYFNHNDNLGTTSQATDHTGATAQDQLYYPWGQEQTMIGNAQEKRFASLGHRDTTETGLDPTHFRMLSSTQGRWLSPDPSNSMRLATPQSLNRYAYVRNKPTTLIDPTGLSNCNTFNVSYEGSGDAFPCNNPDAGTGGGGFGGPSSDPPQPVPPPLYDASIPSPEGFPTFLPGPPGGARPGITITTTLSNPDGTTYSFEDMFYGCGGPSGTANVATNCGTQIGDDLQTLPSGYLNQANLITSDIFTGPYFNFIYTDPLSGWGLINYVFGLSSSPSMPFPSLENPPSCAAAAQAIQNFIATHPGMTIPASLTSAMGPKCSGL